MFDKKQYWKNKEARKNGFRFKPAPAPLVKWTEEDHKAGKCGVEAIGSERTSGVTMHMGKGGLFAVTRRMKRMKDKARGFRDYRKREVFFNKDGVLVDRIVKVEDNVGTLLTRKYARHIQNDEKNPKPKLPLHDPKTTNHSRNVARRNERNQVGGVREAA